MPAACRAGEEGGDEIPARVWRCSPEGDEPRGSALALTAPSPTASEDLSSTRLPAAARNARRLVNERRGARVAPRIRPAGGWRGVGHRAPLPKRRIARGDDDGAEAIFASRPFQRFDADRWEKRSQIVGRGRPSNRGVHP